jgi:3-oxoacyl-[acyl-carrier protein] reductase
VIILHSSASSAALADAVQKSITSLPHHPRALSVCGNLSKPEDPELVMSSIRSWFQREGRETKIDILVNNAGVEVVKPLGNITPDDFAKVYDLNVRGALLMTQAVLPYLQPKGRIINISSVGSRAGFANLGLYCSSKAALEGLTRCWAAELGKNGTTVNAVNPGPVESEMLANIPKDIVQRQKDSTPIEHRVGTVDEVAAVVAWLAGEDSRWVTGQTLSASGGWAMY